MKSKEQQLPPSTQVREELSSQFPHAKPNSAREIVDLTVLRGSSLFILGGFCFRFKSTNITFLSDIVGRHADSLLLMK